MKPEFKKLAMLICIFTAVIIEIICWTLLFPEGGASESLPGNLTFCFALMGSGMVGFGLYVFIFDFLYDLLRFLKTQKG